MPRSKHGKKPARNKSAGRRASALLFPAEAQKMSEVLLDFIEPYRDLTDSDAAFERLISVGALAWNMALLPEIEREQSLDNLAESFFGGKWRVVTRLPKWLMKPFGSNHDDEGESEPAELREFKEIMRAMIERKNRHFGRNRRFILNFHMNPVGDDVQLVVLSTLEKGEMK
jgi:hypothetical protein